MKVSREFLEDFAQLAEFYKWDTAEIEEIKGAVREGSGYREYLQNLAAQFRAVGMIPNREKTK